MRYIYGEYMAKFDARGKSYGIYTQFEYNCTLEYVWYILLDLDLVRFRVLQIMFKLYSVPMVYAEVQWRKDEWSRWPKYEWQLVLIDSTETDKQNKEKKKAKTNEKMPENEISGLNTNESS